MSNFHFSKLITTVWPSLAKETILSKVVNFVDIFKINLSQWFDDIKKKYIDTILKLDNSKTIILETKWRQIRVKNKEISLKGIKTVIVDYSEYQEDSTNVLFIDYVYLTSIPIGTRIVIEWTSCQLQVSEHDSQTIVCDVIVWDKLVFNQHVSFQEYNPNIPFISTKDQKDIIRWLNAGVNMIIASGVKTSADISELKEFLLANKGKNIRIFARIQHQESIDNIEDILKVCDWITFRRNSLDSMTIHDWVLHEYTIIRLCKEYHKPCTVEINYNEIKQHKKESFEDIMAWYSKECVDCYMLDEETAMWDDPLESVNAVFDYLKKPAPENQRTGEIVKYYNKWETEIIDYIIANAYRMTKELYVKAIICYTTNGYIANKLSSLKIDLPIIVFTKNDDTFRYLTLLRGIKWYKISQWFNYENLKRIGKEMIRITFKWNISLDDKIVIIQANEMTDELERSNYAQSGMINGVEVYKFKEI